jgi:peptidyl-prolyl cis-trans isomerase SurA
MGFYLRTIIFCFFVTLATHLNAGTDQPSGDQDLPTGEEVHGVEWTGAKPAYTNGIAAVVNGHAITAERVRMDVAPMLERLRMAASSEEDFEKRILAAELEVLNNIIDRKLIVDAFFERGGKIPDFYNEKEYENYERNLSGGDRLKFSKFLKEYGKTVREFKNDVKERTIVQFMSHEFRASQMEVSPVKIKEYYDTHMPEFFHDSEVELKQIVIYGDEHSEEKLQLICDELAKGCDFHEIAEKYSENMSGYDMGYVLRGDLLNEVAQAIENVEVGKYSDGVALGNATCIFLVAAEKSARQLTLEEASPSIENKLSSQYQEDAYKRWIQKLRDRAHIKIYIEE